MCRFDMPTALQQIRQCIERLKAHQDHWLMTRNTNVLPSYEQCGEMVRALERAVKALEVPETITGAARDDKPCGYAAERNGCESAYQMKGTPGASN